MSDINKLQPVWALKTPLIFQIVIIASGLHTDIRMVQICSGRTTNTSILWKYFECCRERHWRRVFCIAMKYVKENSEGRCVVPDNYSYFSDILQKSLRGPSAVHLSEVWPTVSPEDLNLQHVRKHFVTHRRTISLVTHTHLKALLLYIGVQP